jgi:hypothetical protein
MSYNPLEDSLRARKTPIVGVREKEYGKTHDIYTGAPCDWSKDQGATHTLYCGETEGKYGSPGRGTRPAILKKSVLYVGTDEDEYGKIVWEKWDIKTLWTYENN